MQIGNPRNARGVTLVELLLVIAILMILLSVAVPTMQPGLESRRIREASREIDIYITSARSRAMGSGRPCGVMIRRGMETETDSDGDGKPDIYLPQCSLVLAQAEVPPSYAGLTLDTRARVQITGGAGGFVELIATLIPAIDPSLVSPGDLLQFNYQGPMYTIVAAKDSALQLQIDVTQGQQLPWPVAAQNLSSEPVPFEIFRRPVKSLATPLQLPAATVIDLEASGFDPQPPAPLVSFAPVAPDDASSIYIMFSPGGTVDRVYSSSFSGHPTGPIFLLVGKRDKIPAADGEENWRDLTNLWVTLNPQTGLVSLTEVAMSDTMVGSREFAREGQSMGGK